MLACEHFNTHIGDCAQMESYTRKAFYGFAWLTAGAVIANVGGYLLRLLLARSLTVEEYGLVYAIIALFGLVTVFQHLGLDEAVARRISGALVKGEGASSRPIVAWSALVLYISTAILGLAAFLLAPWLAQRYVGSADAAPLVRIFAAGFMISPITFVITSAFRGLQRMGLLALYNVTQSLVLLAATALLLARGMGVASAMYAYITMYAIQHLVFIPLAVRALPMREKREGLFADRRLPLELLAYGLPVMLTGVASALLTFTDTFLLALLSDLTQVGMYQAALPTAMALTFLSSVLVTVLLPLISELWERGERALIAHAVGDLYRYALIGMLPLAAGAMAYPGILLNLLFGPEYVGGAPVLSLLAGAAVLLTLNAITMAALSGIGFPKDTTKAVVTGALLNVALNLLLIPRYGGLGAAAATLISTATICAISITLLRRRLEAAVSISSLFRIALSGAAFCLVLWACRMLPLDAHPYAKIAIAVALAGAAYALVLLASRAVTVDELKGLKKRILASKK